MSMWNWRCWLVWRSIEKLFLPVLLVYLFVFLLRSSHRYLFLIWSCLFSFLDACLSAFFCFVSIFFRLFWGTFIVCVRDYLCLLAGPLFASFPIWISSVPMRIGTICRWCMREYLAPWRVSPYVSLYFSVCRLRWSAL